MDMAAYLSDQRDALREALDVTVRREAKLAERWAAVRDERDALRAALEQTRYFINDALMCDDDLGANRDYLYMALDVEAPRAS